MLTPEEMQGYGLAGVFIAAFLGGSIVPFSSELVVYAAIAGGLPPVAVFLLACLGNSFAVFLNYGLGYWAHKGLTRWVRIPKRSVLQLQKVGWPALLLSWVPVIGDPLTVGAGFLKMNFLRFVMLSLPLRWARYGFIVLAW
jgi:membrane protein YqaA with SNARE-associated domain